jgi:hypothetical protein
MTECKCVVGCVVIGGVERDMVTEREYIVRSMPKDNFRKHKFCFKCGKAIDWVKIEERKTNGKS